MTLEESFRQRAGILFRPIEQPVVNVVAVFVIVMSLVPVWIAQRLTAGRAGVVRGGGTR
jgi:putative spermidine/putrescine transport system permease protein